MLSAFAWPEDEDRSSGTCCNKRQYGIEAGVQRRGGLTRAASSSATADSRPFFFKKVRTMPTAHSW